MISKRNIKNFFSLSLAEGVGHFLLFFVVIYLARTLGVEGLGKITFARSIIIYFLLITNAGLDLYAIRTVSRNYQLINRSISQVISLRLFLAFVAYAILLLLVFFIPRDYETKQLILWYGGLIFIFALLLDWPFQAVEKMQYVALGRIIGEGGYLVLAIILVHGYSDIISVSLSRVLSRAIQVSFLIILCWKFFGKIKFRCEFTQWKSMLKKSFPMGFGIIMIQIYYSLDVVMLGLIRSDKEVGFYAAAYKIILVIALVGEVFQKSIYPSLSRLSNASKSKLNRLLGDSLKVALIFAVPVIFLGFVASYELITLIYGQGYEKSAFVFQILIFNILCVWINGLVAHAVLASDKEKKYLRGVTIGALFNFGLNLVMIPLWGMMGAAIATILSEVCVLVYFYASFLVHIKTKLIEGFYRIFLSAVIIGLITALLKNLTGLFFSVPFILFAYILLLLNFKVFNLKSAVSLIKSQSKGLKGHNP